MPGIRLPFSSAVRTTGAPDLPPLAFFLVLRAELAALRLAPDDGIETDDGSLRLMAVRRVRLSRRTTAK